MLSPNTTGASYHPHRHVEVRPGMEPGELDNNVSAFMRERAIGAVLAFSGGADDSSPVLSAFRDALIKEAGLTDDLRERLPALIKQAGNDNIARIVRDILLPLRGYRIAVLTGGTLWGVPRVAAEVAKELGFPTIGVYPVAAKEKNILSPSIIDFSVRVHPFCGKSRWGDEAFIFTKLLSTAIIIGGGAGTMVEVSHLLKSNEDLSEPAKWIIPIAGTGGTADKLSFFPGKVETVATCIPPFPIRTGKEVVDFLFANNVITDDICELAEGTQS